MTVARAFPLPTALAPLRRLDDPARLAAVASVGLVDEPVNPGLAQLVLHAARLLGAPTAVVSVIEARRQFVAAGHGLAGPLAGVREVPLSHSLCAYGVRTDAPLVIDDTRNDERWVDHPAAVELGIAAYCGVPLRTTEGQTIGMLCAADGAPRSWSAEDVELLAALAATVVAEIELRASNRALVAREAALAESARELRAMFGAMHDVVLVLDRDGVYRRVVPTAPDLLYRPAEDVVGRRMHDVLPRASADRFLAAIGAALDSGRAVEISYSLPVPAGERHFEATVSPFADDVVLWVARDVTTRAMAEAERARLSAVLEATTDFVGIAEPDGTRAYLNPAGRRLVGALSDAEVLGRPVDAIHTPESRERQHAVARPTAVREGWWSGESMLRAADGREVPVSQVLVAHRDGRGELDFFATIMRDLTPVKEVERALRASEARFRAISAASPVGIFEMDPDGRAHYVNPRLCALWALPERDMLGTGWQGRVHVADLAPLLHDWLAASRAGEEFDRVYRLLHGAADGGPPAVRWVHARSAPLRDDAGAVVGIVGTVEDVTGRGAAEAAARRLTAIIEATPDVVAIATPAGRVEYLNGAGRRLLGIEGGAKAVAGARLTVAQLQPQFAPGGAEYGAVAQALLEGSWSGETALTRCDGRTIPVDEVLLTHRGADGAVEYLSATLRDITKRKHAEAALRSLALVDELTQLYNRRGFLALAEQACEAAIAAGHGGALFYLDLDDFKPVNDRYGHAEGDRALATVADVLRRTFRDGDVVARLGGDEFVAFAPCGSTTAEGAWETVERVHSRLDSLTAAANATGVRPYVLRYSVGVAVLDPARPERIAGLMAAADAQLYLTKRQRRGAKAARGATEAE